MKLAYLLARKDYFELGKNGRVTHAKGIAEGLSLNSVDVDIYSSNSASEHISALGISFFTGKDNFFWQTSLLYKLIKNRKKYDFLIVRYSTMLGWLHLIVLTLFFSKSWGFEVNSLGYHQLSSRKTLRMRLLKNFVRIFERFIISKAPFINCVSNNIFNDLVSISNNLTVLPNAGNEINSAMSGVNYESDGSKIKLVYFGMFHHYYALTDLAIDISKLSKIDIELHLYGSGEQEIKLSEIEALSNNIFLHGSYNLDDLIKSGDLSGRTFLVLPYKEGTIADFGSPTKLFEYMAMGLPIISTSFAQPFDLLSIVKEKYPNCIYFYDSSITEIVKYLSVNEFVDREGLINMFLSEHTWENRCKEYIETINNHLFKLNL